jgi:RHS repeat-associated protein
MALCTAASLLAAPVPRELIPASSPRGAHILVAGTGLDSPSLAVAFTNASGAAVAAPIVARARTFVELIVPSAAVSGNVVVSADGASIGTFPFTLLSPAPYVKTSTILASDRQHDVLKQPSGVAVATGNGTIYVADTKHHQIKLVSSTGVVLSVIGTGAPGMTNGPATQAQFKEPRGIAFDNIQKIAYVADSGNHAIRRIAVDGTVTTIAGSDRPDDADGTGMQAGFKSPSGITLGFDGYLYVADSGNDKIRRVSLAGVVTTVAGGVHAGFADGPNAQALFKGPEGIAATPAGELFVADTQNHAIRKIANGMVSTVAGTGHGGFLDGPATIAEFKEPSGVAIDEAGNVVVADTKNHSLRMISTGLAPVVVTTIAGTRKEDFVDGTPAAARFKEPSDVVVQGAAFIADSKNDAVRVLYAALAVSAIYPREADPNGGTVVRVFGTGFVPGATQVVFGNAPAASITYIASTEILAVAPPHANGATDVVVTSPAGTATLRNTFLYIPPFTALQIAPASPTLTSGQRQQFTLTGVRADNTTADLTNRASWDSSNRSVATIDATGLATAVAAGTTTITAAFENLTQSVLLTVAAPETLPPDPATVATPIDGTVVTSISDTVEFLYTGSNPVQRGVRPGTIKSNRVAVLRGQVRSATSAPLPGVRVSILGRPEFGFTLTRSDGWYDLAVNGGGDLTIEYQKNGHLSAQRRTHTPWRDFVVMGDVYMTSFDAAATTVNMGAPAIQVARGSLITDGDGSRRATLFIPGGTTATIETASGSQIVPKLTLRATEFSVGPNGPKMMPAALPPASAYTYCVELSADEAVAANATNVRFSKPVAFYVDNFLGFRAGTPVPVGYYDRTKGAWIASDNGITLRIVAVDAGRASVDLTGDGIADDPTGIGISTEELQQLAALYQPGQTLWRVTTDHFTPLDLNFPIDSPVGAERPNNDPPPHSPTVDSPTTTCGSIIDCHNQVFGESIPIVGTPFSLEYQSNQVSGHLAGRTVDIPISRTTVPSPLKRIDVDVSIMGRIFHFERPPVAGQSIRYTWDGLDAYGRQPQGSQVAHIQIGYVYDTVYTSPAAGDRSFALYSSDRAALRQSRQEFSVTQQSDVLLGEVTAAPLGLGGWRIDANEVLNISGGVLTRGPGESITTSLQRPVITTFAGGGLSTAPAGVATDMQLDFPWAIAPAPDGSIYISENANFGEGVIRRVAPGGLVSTAVNAGGVTAMTMGPDEALYFTNGGRLWRGDPITGMMTELGAPPGCCNALAFGPEGNLYIAASGIVRLNADGTFSAVTGDASLPTTFRPDGLPALRTNVGARGIAAGPDGSVYFSMGARVYRIPPTGIIERFAGTDAFTTGFSGDGGPAIQAELSHPDALAVAPDGSLYITDSNTYTIRRVLPNGVITTVAGNPAFLDYSLDGTPAAGSYVDFPKRLAVGSDGAVYVSDVFLMTVRKVAPPDLSATAGRTIVVPSSDGRMATIFGPQGRHEKTVDAITNATLYSFQYDTAGRLASITDSYGNLTRIERDASGSATAITSPFGSRTALAIDNGYLTSITNPAGERFDMTYTAEGLLTTFKNPRGIPKTITYDTLGRFIREDRADGGALTIAGSPAIGGSFEVSVRSAEGQTTTHQIQRDRSGNDLRIDTETATQLTTTTLRARDGSQSITLPDGSSISQTIQGDPRFQSLAPLRTTSVRTPGGRRLSLQNGRSVALSNRFDPLAVTSLTETFSLNGRPWQTTYTSVTRTLLGRTPAGRQSTAILNGNGDVTSVQVTGLASVAFGYNTIGQLTSIQQSSRQTAFVYNGSGLVERVTDPLSRSMAFMYDKGGRVTQQTLPDGRVITFTYDANGNLTSITPPSRPAHAFAWTAGDQQQQYSPPLVPSSGATQFAYNRDRQLTSVLRPDGQSIGLSYDLAGRLTTMTTPSGIYGFAYSTQTGALTAVTAAGGANVGYRYDGPLLTSVEWSGPVTGSVAYTYDNDFRVTSEAGTGFSYDTDGLLTTAGALSLRRDPANGLLNGTTLDGVTDSYTYNEHGEVTGYNAMFGGATIFSEAYVRDAAGRIQQKTETVFGGPAVKSFGYDVAGRLASVTEGINTTQYAYDSNSNRTTKTTGVKVESATYDAQDRLLTYGDSTYSYTANGELLAKTDAAATTRYQYDVLGNVRSVSLPDGRTIEYVIDAQNRRVGKKVNGALVRGWLYGDQLRIIAELDGNSAVISRFVYGSHTNVPDYMIWNGVNYRILADHLGSPRLIINAATGAIAQQIGYDEFGNVLADTAPGFQPFGFAGGLYDPDTKLVRFGARDYDGRVGRWTAKDLILFDGGDTNLYGYTFADPVNLIDLSGLDIFVNYYSRGPTHLGMGVNTTESVGFYPVSTSAFIPLGVARPGEVRLDAGNPDWTIRFHTNRIQDRRAIEAINRRIRNPGDYDLYRRDCVFFVQDVLEEIGILTPETFIPDRWLHNVINDWRLDSTVIRKPYP